MIRRGTPPILWALLGLLAIAGFAIALGQRDRNVEPSVSNFGPSGESALFSLLKQSGYRVDVDLSSNPHLGSRDIALCMRPSDRKVFRHLADPEDESSDAPQEPFKQNLTQFLQRGGRAVVFGYADEFSDQSHRALDQGPSDVTNSVVAGKLKVMAENDPIDAALLPTDHVGTFAAKIWTLNDSPMVWITTVGKGKVVVCNSNLPTSNRFLDKADDAKFVLNTIDLMARPGDRIVFTEASFGNIANPGLLEMIGSWALAAWRQAIVLFLVLVYSLGKRFGYPEERRRVVQSSRDLADAFGNLLHRSDKVEVALGAALGRMDQRLRAYLRIPRDASERERDRLLPESITNAIHRIRLAQIDDGVRVVDALKLIQLADHEIDSYLFSVTHERSA